MANSILYNVGEGVALGTNLALLKRNEDSVRAGRATFLIGVCQSAQVSLATTHVTRALEASRVVEIPSNAATIAMRCVIAVLPFFLGCAIQRGIANDTVRYICLFLQDHLGDLCQIVSLVGAVALIVFGNIAVGAASLTFIVLGGLDRYGLFPEKVSYLFRKATIPLMIVSSLLTGGVVEKLFAVISLTAIGYEQYTKWKNRDVVQDFENRETHLKQEQEAFMRAHPELIAQSGAAAVVHSGLLTPETLQQILDGYALQVNPLHLKAAINIKAADTTKLDMLLTQFDAVEWYNENMQGLRTKLLEDDRFRQLNGVSTIDDLQAKGIRDPALVVYARKQLEHYINQIKARHIDAGAIHEYDRLENYLKVVIDQLALLEDPRDRASYIARLAVEGGQYCGPGRFHAVEEVWAMLVWKKKDVPLGTKILFHLQDARTEKVREEYQEVAGYFVAGDWRFRLLNYLVNVTDLHTYNQVINLYGEDFGIRKGAADNDELAVIQPLQRLAVQRLVTRLREAFFYFYDVNYIVGKIQETLGDKRLPKLDVYAWWDHWMLKQDAVNGISLHDIYAEKLTIYDHPLQGDNLRFNPLFIKAMLFDMGILEFEINTQVIPK
jgi:hypothetical protein